MRKLKATTVALSTVAALLATGGAATAVATAGDDAAPASAEAGRADASQKQGPKKDGAKKLCKRAPKIDKKIDRVLRRIDGDAKKRGSLDRLEKRIDNAKKEGHDTVAGFLEERLKDRRALGPRLKDRKKGLAKVEAWCEKQYKPKDEDKSEGENGGSSES